MKRLFSILALVLCLASPAWATFPSVVGTPGGGNENANVTSHTINRPAGCCTSGNLLIDIFVTDGTPTISGWPAGYTQIDIGNDGGGSTRTEVRYKIADGTEGATYSLTTSVAERSAHTTYEITSWHGTTAPEVGTAATGSSANPNPPSLSPSWGADDTLWLAISANDRGGDGGVSAYPTSYTNGINNLSNNAAGVSLGSAERQLNAASEDPGTFTVPSNDWRAQTVAIRPAAAGGGPTCPKTLLTLGVGC